MNTRRKRSANRPPECSENETPNADSPTSSSSQKSSKLASAGSALDECVGVICLVEVTLHSLEWQEIGFPEQEVLRRALKAIWSVHDWIDELTSNALDDPTAGREDEP